MEESTRAPSNAALLCAALSVLTVVVSAQQPSQRGLVAVPEQTPQSWGEYSALVIGINDYLEFPQLATAVKDALDIRELLTHEYGFDPERVVFLWDRDATLSRIERELRRAAQQLGPNDNLLVYFAGHGQIDDLTGGGYWIPVDAKVGDHTTWLAHEHVRAILSSEKVQGRNICVIADSCYAGTLLRGGASNRLDPDERRYLEKLRQLARRKSRQVITSGGKEPVEDGGRDGNSLFAWYFLNALRENKREAIDLESLILTQVYDQVMRLGGQRPTVGRLRTPMDEDGQFVLVRSAASSGAKSSMKVSVSVFRSIFWPEAATLQVQVSSKEGAPISGVHVKAWERLGSWNDFLRFGSGRWLGTVSGLEHKTGKTDAKGQFSAIWTCDGCEGVHRFQVEASKPGYEVATASDIIDMEVRGPLWSK
jgi:hypothetical protein